jgi:hypothetical protein
MSSARKECWVWITNLNTKSLYKNFSKRLG